MNRILLVEDNDTLGYVLREYLEMKGFEVNLARNGKEGLHLFKKQAYDLSILDIMMPEMDGLTLAREIRLLDRGAAAIRPPPLPAAIRAVSAARRRLASEISVAWA